MQQHSFVVESDVGGLFYMRCKFPDKEGTSHAFSTGAKEEEEGGRRHGFLRKEEGGSLRSTTPISFAKE